MMFKRKLTPDEINALEWNIEGLCKNPDTHAQLMAIVESELPMLAQIPLKKEPFPHPPVRVKWRRIYRNRLGR